MSATFEPDSMKGWRLQAKSDLMPDAVAYGRLIRCVSEQNIGDAETVAQKILSVNEALGGHHRMNVQMTLAAVPHAKMLRSIEILGTEVAPRVRRAFEPS